MSNLKPCPFCGGTDIRQHFDYPIHIWSIKCRNCGGKMQRYGSQQQAVTAWNRRVNDESTNH